MSFGNFITKKRTLMRLRNCYVPYLCLFLLFCTSLFAKKSAASLQIYAIDVEGGQSTLLVTPTGQSMLVDTGWPGFDGRDADRIVAAAKLAGVHRIDYLLITHYHTDHVGGITQLAEKMKIVNFVDHGPNIEDSDTTRQGYAAYEAAVAKMNGKRTTVKPGDRIPVTGIDVQVLVAGREHISSPLHGAGKPNTFCASEPPPPDDPSENSASMGVLVTYGKFRFLDLGDLTKKKELELMCPNNPIGKVDVFLVNHHGLFQSNSKALVHAIHPKVAIMDNGPKKGGSPEAWQIVHDSPGLEDLWQLHYAVGSDQAHNSAENLIANRDEADGNYIKLVAKQDGSFVVSNSRNEFRKDYAKVK